MVNRLCSSITNTNLRSKTSLFQVKGVFLSVKLMKLVDLLVSLHSCHFFTSLFHFLLSLDSTKFHCFDLLLRFLSDSISVSKHLLGIDIFKSHLLILLRPDESILDFVILEDVVWIHQLLSFAFFRLFLSQSSGSFFLWSLQCLLHFLLIFSS